MTYSGKKIDQLLKKALDKHHAGHFREAEEIYKRLARNNPLHLDAHYLLGTLYAEHGAYDQALKYLARAAEIDPRSPLVHNNLGNVHWLRDDLDNAVKHFRRALEIDPGLAEAWNNVGSILLQQGRNAEAIPYYEKTLTLKPDFVKALHSLGKAHLGADNPDEAVRCFRRVLELDPGYSAAHEGLGSACLKKSEREAAIFHFNKYLESGAADSGEVTLKLAMLNAVPLPEKMPEALVRQTYRKKAATWEQDIAQPAKEFLGPAHVRAAVEKATAGRAGLAVLDIGCGTGICGEFLRSLASRLDGVDLSEDMLHEARAKGIYDQLECGEVAAFMSGHPGAYDLITASGVLIFFGDLGAVLRAAAAALRPGGAFVFTLYRSDGPDVAVRDNLHFAHSETHLRRRAAEAQLAVAAMEKAVHEYNHGQPWDGFIVTLRKGVTPPTN